MTTRRKTIRCQRWPALDSFPRLLYWIGITIVFAFVVGAMALVVLQAVDQWRRQ